MRKLYLVVLVLVLLCGCTKKVVENTGEQAKITPSISQVAVITPEVGGQLNTTETFEPEILPGMDEIAIDQTQFTDPYFCEFVKETVDLNHNGYLSKEECNQVYVLDFTGSIDKESCPRKAFDVIDGLEVFPNLRFLYVDEVKQVILKNHPSICYIEVKNQVEYLHVEDCPNFVELTDCAEANIKSYYIAGVNEECRRYTRYNGAYTQMIQLSRVCNVKLERDISGVLCREGKYTLFENPGVPWLKKTTQGIEIDNSFFMKDIIHRDLKVKGAWLTGYYEENGVRIDCLVDDEKAQGYGFYIPSDAWDGSPSFYLLGQRPAVPEELLLKSGERSSVCSVKSWGQGFEILVAAEPEVYYQVNGEEILLANTEIAPRGTEDGNAYHYPVYYFELYYDPNGNPVNVKELDDLEALLQQPVDVTSILPIAEETVPVPGCRRYLNEKYNYDQQYGLSATELEGVRILNYLDGYGMFEQTIKHLELFPNLTDVYLKETKVLVVDGHSGLNYIGGDASRLRCVILRNCPNLQKVDLDLSQVETIWVDNCPLLGDSLTNRVSEKYPVEAQLAVEQNRKWSLENPELGSIVTFGQFEQDGDDENGLEWIEWIVLDRTDKGALLLSKNVLDVMPFQHAGNTAKWENSDIHQWLNNDFYNTAFRDEEKRFIIKGQKEYYGMEDEYYELIQSESVFLLDFDQLTHKETEYSAGYAYRKPYFFSKASRQAVPSESAGNKLLLEDENADIQKVAWWSATSITDGKKACYVDAEGNVRTDGIEKSNGMIGVRPAIWVNLSNIGELADKRLG